MYRARELKITIQSWLIAYLWLLKPIHATTISEREPGHVDENLEKLRFT